MPNVNDSIARRYTVLQGQYRIIPFGIITTESIRVVYYSELTDYVCAIGMRQTIPVLNNKHVLVARL